MIGLYENSADKYDLQIKVEPHIYFDLNEYFVAFQCVMQKQTRLASYLYCLWCYVLNVRNLQTYYFDLK